MDILGVGFPELVFIFIIALMVFGPRRLPEIAARAGKTVRDLRNMSQGLLTEWQREITVAARLDELEQARKELAEVKKELKDTQRTVSSDTSAELKQAQKEIEQVKQELQDVKAIEVPRASSEAVKESEQSEPPEAAAADSEPQSTEAEDTPQPASDEEASETTQEAESDQATDATPASSPTGEEDQDVDDLKSEIQQTEPRIAPQVSSK